MSLFDSLWNLSQQQEIHELRGSLDRLRLEHDLAAQDPHKLADENLELKVRLGLLVRLLIRKGIITAEEYAALISEARPKS